MEERLWGISFTIAFVSVVLKRDQLSSTTEFCGAEAKKFSAESDMVFLKLSKSALLRSKTLSVGGLNDLVALTFIWKRIARWSLIPGTVWTSEITCGYDENNKSKVFPDVGRVRHFTCCVSEKSSVIRSSLLCRVKVAWLKANGTSADQLISPRLKWPATVILGWWLEDSKIQFMESENCSKASWGKFGGLPYV